MALLVVNEGKVDILDLLNGGNFPANVQIGLFKNNLVPDKDTVLADVTAANFSGYSSATPAFDPATLSTDKGVMVQNPATDFMHNGGGTSNTIYGYYVWDNGAGVLLWIELISPSQLMSNNGDTLSVTARLTCDTE